MTQKTLPTPAEGNEMSPNPAPGPDEAELEAMCRAHDLEDAAQRGEPDPWILDPDAWVHTLGSAETQLQDFEVFRQDRLSAMRAALAASTLPERVAELEGERDRLAINAARFEHLLEHHSYHYGMSVVEPSPAEWGIQWQYQQYKPGEQFLSICDLIDAEIAFIAAEEQAAEAEATQPEVKS